MEVLVSRVDAKSAARAQGMAEFQEFRETWIGELEGIQEAQAKLTETVNMQGAALKDLEIDVGTMREELQKLGQVDDADRKAAKQSVTHLQHKVESAMQDRLAAHQLLQKRIQLVETRVTGCEKLQDSLTAMQEDLSSVQDVQRQLLATVTDMGESLDTLVNRDQPVSPSEIGRAHV